MPEETSGRLEASDRLRNLEVRVRELEKAVWTATAKLTNGIASAREVGELKDRIRDQESQLEAIKSKTFKWEGGGSVIYIIITLLGGLLGWFLSHAGIGR